MLEAQSYQASIIFFQQMLLFMLHEQQISKGFTHMHLVFCWI